MSQLKAIICPSILNADLSKLADECAKLLASGADALHLDVMDGHFVPNLSFGAPVIECLRKQLGTGAFFDVHLMVSNPMQWIDPMAKAGATQYTFHLEAIESHDAIVNLIERIKQCNMRVGLAIKPNTSVDALLPFGASIDNALVMTVEPGFGGQSFMSPMMSKVRKLRAAYPTLNIQVDGGISLANIDECADAGANVIVSGTGIIRTADPTSTITAMRKSVTNAIERERSQ